MNTILKRIDGSILDFSKLENNKDILDFLSQKKNQTDFILNEINSGYYDRFFEDEKDLIILDMGAHIGMFSNYISPAAAIIYSFEPFPKHFNLLESITLNDKKILTFNYAINTENGKNIKFYVRPENPTMNGLNHNNDGYYVDEGISVNTINLKEICKMSPYFDFVKMDIEGAEYDVFAQLSEDEYLRNLVAGKFKSILIECHDNYKKNRSDTLIFVNDILLKMEYNVEKINEATLFAELRF